MFLFVFLRLGQVMVIDHGRYSVLAQGQHLYEQEIVANRGEIYTADGFPLVINSNVYLMFAVPSEMKDKKEVQTLITDKVIELVEKTEQIKIKKQNDDQAKEPLTEDGTGESDTLRKINFPESLQSLNDRFRFAKKDNLVEGDWKKTLKEELAMKLDEVFKQDDNQFVQLLTGLNELQKNQIGNLELAGIHFQLGQKRKYPEDELASQLLGFVGKNDSGDDQGYFGLEGYYNGDLSGSAGYELHERDVIGQKIPFGLSKTRKPSHGRDLVLTIRRELQYLVERKLDEGVKKYGAQDGTAILMDPDSGAVWVMASSPNYLPEYWTEYLKGETDVSKIDVYKNHAISANYEPGSVMKPFTMGIAINEKVVTPNDYYEDSGPVEYSGYDVKTWNNKYLGSLTMIEVLQYSNNTGAAWVGHQIGFDTYEKYVNDFHLGLPTNIDLQGEEAGIVRDPLEWRDIDLANMAFGQGISLTPLQLTVLFTALINGGVLYEPYIVENIVDHRLAEPMVIKRNPHPIGNVISKETSDQLRFMLRKVVTDGEFKWFVQQAGVENFSIGGKTGTAQIPIGGKYDPHKTNTTFIGFAPTNQPRFVLLVRLNQPTTSSYSADTAVPLWMEIAKDLMVYFGVSPEK